jgi:hypothetical protein
VSFTNLVKPVNSVDRLTLGPFAAGADWTFTVQKLQRILLGFATLTTSAAVGNRNIGVQYFDGVPTKFFEVVNQSAVTASSTQKVWFAASGSNPGTFSVTSATVPQGIILPKLVLLPGYKYVGHVYGMDIADQWSNVELFVETLDSLPPYTV